MPDKPVLLVGIDDNYLSKDLLGKIGSIASNMEIVASRERSVIEKVLDRIEIAFYLYPYDYLLDAVNMRWLQQWGAGSNWLLKAPEMVNRSFILTSSSGAHAVPITEHIFALLLAFARRLHHACKSYTQRERFIPRDERSLFELYGKTILVVGVGAIGSRTAEVARCMGMRVWGVRRDGSRPVPGVERMFGPADLKNALSQADMVVSTLPLTEETRRMIGEKELAAMKPSAILINVGRGETIDQAALARALQERRIAGAGLDVIADRPLPKNSPLWDLDNVILTGHYSAMSVVKQQRVIEIFLENLRRYKSGETLMNIVDKKIGY